MPQHCESIGDGWTTVNGQCVYSPPQIGADTPEGMSPAGSYGPAFAGTVSSLGFGEMFAGTTLEDPKEREKYFDQYSTEAEERYTRAAGTDIGQLGEAWGLRSKQLGETWGLERGELGWGAGLGLREAQRTGIGAQRTSGLSYSGTAKEMERIAKGDVRRKYETGLEAGKSVYEQAMATGELGLEQATTDIYQELEADVYGERKDWKTEQRATLNMLLGRDIYYDPETQYLKDGVITDIPEEQTDKQKCYHNCDGRFGQYNPMRIVCRATCEFS